MQQKLLTAPVLYLSRYIIEHKSAYYEGLRRVTEDNAWGSWILYLLESVTLTARSAIMQIQEIRHAILQFQAELQSKKDSKLARLELVHILFQHPYCRIRDLEEAGIAKRQAASEYLQSLAAMGLLRPIKVGIQVLYLSLTLLKILGK